MCLTYNLFKDLFISIFIFQYLFLMCLTYYSNVFNLSFSMGFSWVFHGFPWFSMVFHGFPWAFHFHFFFFLGFLGWSISCDQGDHYELNAIFDVSQAGIFWASNASNRGTGEGWEGYQQVVRLVRLVRLFWRFWLISVGFRLVRHSETSPSSQFNPWLMVCFEKISGFQPTCFLTTSSFLHVLISYFVVSQDSKSVDWPIFLSRPCLSENIH